MGPIKQGVFTRQGFNAILLVSLFSFFYVFLFMWDNAVIQHILVSKKLMKYEKRYTSSRDMSNDDFSDSSSAIIPSQFHENTSKDSVISPERDLMNRRTNIAAIAEKGEKVDVKKNDSERFTNESLFKESSLRENHEPYSEPQALSNGKDSNEAGPLLPILDKPQQSSSDKRVQIVIVTTKRSGSSFIGELFNSNPDIFYMYEPLFQVTFDVLKHRIDNRQAESLIFSLWNHTLRCDYSNFNLQRPQNWLRRGSISTCQLSGAINSSKLLCPVKDPKREAGQIISELCLDRPYTVLKTIRVMDIKDLRNFLEDPSLNLKIIHLVRDPRAVMNSRRKLREPNSDLSRRKGRHADEIEDLCDHMARNLVYKDGPPSWLKGKYMLVRFEDVAEDPIEQTKRIYQHLGIEMHQDVISWLKTNTHGNNGQKTGNPFSRTRDTKKVINAWKNSISREMRVEVERKCSRVMNALSYWPSL